MSVQQLVPPPPGVSQLEDELPAPKVPVAVNGPSIFVELRVGVVAGHDVIELGVPLPHMSPRQDIALRSSMYSCPTEF